MTHPALNALLDKLEGSVSVDAKGAVTVHDEAKLRQGPIDTLAFAAALSPDPERAVARWLLWQLGQTLGAYPSSIHELYMARGRGEVRRDFTVPAMNLRAMTYVLSQAVFNAAQERSVGAMIFEIARSEIGYTNQRPAEYVSSVLAAAIKTGYRGPLFVQGDHFQISASRHAQDPDAEFKAVCDLTLEALQAGFYNIDVDTSTLVDLSHESLDDQQRVNYELCARLTGFIREHEPEGVTVSVGGEIGEVGGKNSTEPELRAFMEGYLKTLASLNGGSLEGISKISIQTGTSHGGVVLPDGSIAEAKVDFDTLENLSRVAHDEYGLAGAVQHGASTLPPEAFNKFAQANACEVHLATGFQNMMYDHESFPAELLQDIYAYVDAEFSGNRKPDQTDEQFHYKERKRALGRFKPEIWNLPEDIRTAIQASWQEQFAFLFEQLNVVNTFDMAEKYTPIVKIDRPLSAYLEGAEAVEEDVSDLAD
jgi:fructose/tagatose bisphosphate aldolase